MKQGRGLLEKGVKLLMMKEGYRHLMMKQEHGLLEKGVKPLIVVEENAIE
jgi:hypothetical protein